MSTSFEWDGGFFSADTAEFDRAIHRLRRESPAAAREASLIGELAARLKDQPGITRREFDRRIRLIISAIVGVDSTSVQMIAAHLRHTSPDALNAIRTLLPAGLRHVAVLRNSAVAGEMSSPTVPRPSVPSSTEPSKASESAADSSEYRAVALIGTTEEHVRNEGLLKSYNLQPLRLPSIDHLWQIASTGMCGFVVGGSVWGQVKSSEHRRTIRRICEYSTFLFSRICVNGIGPDVARDFTKEAIDARCGPLDGQRFCHGQDCDLSVSDISALQAGANLLEAAGTADFFPLGLSESEAALLRLIAEERRHPIGPVTIHRLGTRELLGGRSGARVFLLNDGGLQPFVAKIGDAEQLAPEIRRHNEWIAHWEPNTTAPTFHSHLGSAAISYRLQATPDALGLPAPTFDDRLEQLRSAEWVETAEKCQSMAEDLYLAIDRAVDRLVQLNSIRAGDHEPASEFWLHWPIRDLASRGIEFEVVDKNWRSIDLWELVQEAVSRLEPNCSRGIVHGDIHGRNILLVDRMPAFIDFACSGPGHPFVDLVRLDAVVRTAAMRMLLSKSSMHDLFHSIYIEGENAATILRRYPFVTVSPLAQLAVRTAAKVREGARLVGLAHKIDFRDFYAMHCVVSAHLLANRHPGSGIERLMLCVLGSEILPDRHCASEGLK